VDKAILDINRICDSVYQYERFLYPVTAIRFERTVGWPERPRVAGVRRTIVDGINDVILTYEISVVASSSSYRDYIQPTLIG